MQDLLACHEMTIARRLLKTEVKIIFPEKKRLCLTVSPYYSVPSQVYYFFFLLQHTMIKDFLKKYILGTSGAKKKSSAK